MATGGANAAADDAGDRVPWHRYTFELEPMDTSFCKPVCTENLNPNVLTMKSAQYGARIYDAGSLNLARDRRILVQ
jgi:hypothetical protein